MKPVAIIGAVVAALVLFVVYRIFKPGYRGATGFKNRHASEISTLRLTGFSQGRGVPYAPELQLEKLQRGE